MKRDINLIYEGFQNKNFRDRDFEFFLKKNSFNVINDLNKKVDVFLLSDYCCLVRRYKNKKYRNSIKYFISGESVLDFKINLLFFITRIFSENFIKKFSFLFSCLFSIQTLYKFYYDPFRGFFNFFKKDKKIFYCIPVAYKNNLGFPYFFFYNKETLSKLLVKKNLPVNRNQKVPPKFCCFVVSNPNNYERIKFFKKLSKYKRIDSYGKIFFNVSKDSLRENYLENYDLFKKYKFVICFENSFINDYITEKLVNVMLANSVPIYRGAPNVGKYFNTQSFINYEDYGQSYDAMIEKVIELDNDDGKYLTFLKQPRLLNDSLPQKYLDKEKIRKKFYQQILNQLVK